MKAGELFLADSPSALDQALDPLRRRGNRIGFVPTMGNLHQGHLSLVKQSLADCDQTVVSLYVNPTQFGPAEDFDQYPRTLESDIEVLKGLDPQIIVFLPADTVIYPHGIRYATQVRVPYLSRRLCGRSRPHFFQGICTVLVRLFQLVRPDMAFFGEKDFQQTRIVSQMVDDLFMPITIKTGSIIREPDGLAMSSRNQYLRPDDRNTALVLSRVVQIAQSAYQRGIRDVNACLAPCRELIGQTPRFKLDYLEIVNPDTLTRRQHQIRPQDRLLIAGYVGQTRLIDNGLLA